MHPLICYAGQISLCHAKIEKISKKLFVMINKDGVGQFLDFMGGTAVMRGDIELMGGPPTKENPVCAAKGSCIATAVDTVLTKYF